MDIQEVISRRVTLEEREGYAFGKCPFHQSGKKTLMVIAELDHYICFDCGREGNADDFIIRLKHAECAAAPVKRKDWRGTVYVLELVGARYYVGYTTSLKRRWKKHLNGKGAEWTRTYPPLRVVEYFEDAPFKMENEITERYMRRYGWEKVRGGDYCGLLKYYTDPASVFRQGPMGAYLLKLAGGYYYVGFAADVDKDIKLQFSGMGCAWTRLHRPLKELCRIATDRESDQRKMTLDAMAKYGWRRVRGYIWMALTIQRPACLPRHERLADRLLVDNYYLI